MEETDNREYLRKIVDELMTDDTWELDPESRVFLVSDLEWSLLGL